MVKDLAGSLFRKQSNKSITSTEIEVKKTLAKKTLRFCT
jgi:hypothetical protein